MKFCSQILLLLIFVVESTEDGLHTIAMRSPDILWGKGSVSGILITLFAVVLSASSLVDSNFGLRPESIWGTAPLAVALAISLDTNDSNVDCLLLYKSSILVGCAISNTTSPIGADNDDEFELDDEFKLDVAKNSSLCGVGVLDVNKGCI